MDKPQRRVLAIANRGEIAIRLARTARRLGWQPVALLGNPDLASLAAREIGSVEPIGPAGSELDVDAVINAATRAGATALHPGYGFLSEREALSHACQEAGITFIGPSSETLAICGDKIATREAALRAGVPVLPATEPLSLDDQQRWGTEAERVGFPLIAKVAGGGGGRGLRLAENASSLDDAVRAALREAGASGAGTRLYLERFLGGARHVEVQVAGNGHDAVVLGDRDCSVQRRHQKVVEEAPAFGLNDGLRDRLHGYAAAMAREVRLRGLGTVEFLLSSDADLYFIEVNPRLQVEHTVTEEVTGLDLVATQFQLAFSDTLPDAPNPAGHAFQARIYAEDPFHGSIPTPGHISTLGWPRGSGVRVDVGYASGDTIPSTYDAMIGKIITWGATRQDALDRLHQAIVDLRVAGDAGDGQPVMTNQPWLLELLDHPAFRSATHTLELAGDISVAERSPAPSELVPAIAALLNGSPNSPDAWSSSGPFRMVGSAVQLLHGAEAGGWEQRFEVRADHGPSGWYAVAEDGSAISIPQGHDDALPRQMEAVEIVTPHGRWLARLGPALERQAADDTADGLLRAPMPGTVTTVNATPGQPVNRGDVVVVMVAMKIEMAMAAPFDGIVERIEVQAGDLVSSRQVLAVVGPSSNGDSDA